ncbi:MAG: protein kinase [Verrucomicrobiales bacterium]|nr:protein kinase [Verrucomicrobiae bacterium]
MGIVYLAERIVEPRYQVAIKTAPDFAEWVAKKSGKADRTTEGYFSLLRRFHREALSWVQLGFHPNIVLAHKVIEDGGKPYLILSYIDLGDLSRLIQKKVLTVPKCVNFAIQFCRGMQHAVERMGLIHRDIKPLNILIDRNGRLKVTDFGLAKVQLEQEFGDNPATTASPELSEAGAGTLPYMAPEQFDSLSRADTRSDIFSFGATLFEMLTGHRLFIRPSWEMALREERPPLCHERDSQVPPALSEIVSKCCRYDPVERFQSFVELEESLRSVEATLEDPVPILEDPSSLDPELYTSMIAVESESYALISLGRFGEAAGKAIEGIHIDPGNSSPWINLSKALVELGKFWEARRCSERAVELDPGNKRAWANLGWAELATGEPQLGAESSERATVLDPDFPDAWMCRGRCTVELGAVAEGLHLLEKARSLSPNDWKIHANIAQSQFSAGNKDSALESYEEASRLNPGDGGIQMNMAMLRSELGNIRGAFEGIEAALELDPESATVWAAKAILLFDHRGDISGAHDALSRSEALEPDNRVLSMARSRIPAEIGGWDTPSVAVGFPSPVHSPSGTPAEAHPESSVPITPEAPPEIISRATALRRDFSSPANFEQAEVLFRQGVRENQNAWVAYYGLGELLAVKASRADRGAEEILDEAARNFETVVRLNPAFDAARFRLAAIIAKSNFARAKTIYEEALAGPQTEIPDPLYPHDWLGGSHWEFAIRAAKNNARDISVDAFCRAIRMDESYYGRTIEPQPALANLAWRQALHRLGLR